MVISIALVLFLMGIAYSLMLSMPDCIRLFQGTHWRFRDFVQRNERCGFNPDNQTDVGSGVLCDAVREASFVSREQGASGKWPNYSVRGFWIFFEYNPPPASIELRLNAPYVQNDSIALLESHLAKFRQIEEVSYQAPLISLINKNLRNIGMVLGVIIFDPFNYLFCFDTQHHKTFVYARRFTIYTMRLVYQTVYP